MQKVVRRGLPCTVRHTLCPRKLEFHTAPTAFAAGSFTTLSPLVRVGATPKVARKNPQMGSTAVFRGSPPTSVSGLPWVPQYSCCAQPRMSPNPELMREMNPSYASSARPAAPSAANCSPGVWKKLPPFS